MKYIPGGTLAFTTLTSPNFQVSTGGREKFLSNLTEEGRRVYSQENNFYDANMANVLQMQQIQTNMADYGVQLQPDAVYAITTDIAMKSANQAMSMWMMCEPSVKEHYNSGETAFDYEPVSDAVGFRDHLYRLCTNDMMVEEKGNSIVRHMVSNVADPYNLTFQNKVDILKSHNYVRRYLKENSNIELDETIYY